MLNAPLLLLSIIYVLYYSRQKGLRQIMYLCLPGFLLILPFIARNVILSGYAFFPVYQLDWFSFDWKADKSGLIEISEYIKYFNRINSGFRSIGETRALNLDQWVGLWYYYLYRIDKIIFTVSMIGYVYILFRFRAIFTFLQKCFAGVMAIQLICWFFSAPDPRFAQGSLLFGIYAALLAAPIAGKKIRTGLKLLTISLSALVLLYGLSKIAGGGKVSQFHCAACTADTASPDHRNWSYYNAHSFQDIE